MLQFAEEVDALAQQVHADDAQACLITSPLAYSRLYECRSNQCLLQPELPPHHALAGT
jgi:hypothetical protein